MAGLHTALCAHALPCAPCTRAAHRRGGCGRTPLPRGTMRLPPSGHAACPNAPASLPHQEISKDTASGVEVQLRGNTLRELVGWVPGPKDTPYEGGRYEIQARCSLGGTCRSRQRTCSQPRTHTRAHMRPGHIHADHPRRPVPVPAAQDAVRHKSACRAWQQGGKGLARATQHTQAAGLGLEAVFQLLPCASNPEPVLRGPASARRCCSPHPLRSAVGQGSCRAPTSRSWLCVGLCQLKRLLQLHRGSPGVCDVR